MLGKGHVAASDGPSSIFDVSPTGKLARFGGYPGCNP